jgi:hypothetical protein
MQELQEQPVYAPHLNEWLRRRWHKDLIKPQPLADAPEEFDKPAGNPVDPDTIRKFHELLKTTTDSANVIRKNLHTSIESYYQFCEEYAKEEPIILRDRQNKIRSHEWPPKEV